MIFFKNFIFYTDRQTYSYIKIEIEGTNEIVTYLPYKMTNKELTEKPNDRRDNQSTTY